MCGTRAPVLLVLLSLAGYRCSHLVINDTTFASLPPLNRLDEWAQCQGDGDVYCAVDAALVSEAPSDILTLLQEYSRDTLKHYNRTQVHRGLCVSRCGAEEEGANPWHSAAASCLNQELAKYGLQAEILSVGWCMRPEPAEPSASARALAAVVVALVALSVLATAVHVLGEKCAKVDGNKYLLAFSLKQNWRILTYNRNKPRSDQRMKDLTSIEGIRVLGIQGVIMSHVTFMCIYSYTSNPEFLEKMYASFGTQLMLSSPVWMQAFFSISAFLTTYSVLITVDRNPMTFVKCLMSIVNRYIRLTPAAGIAVWFAMTWYPLLGTGPQWGWHVLREASDCSESWWRHLLYLQNHPKTGHMCMGQTWYIAADIQLHIIGILVLYLLVKCRKATWPVLALMAIGSSVAGGLVSYAYQIKPLPTGQSFEALRTLFLDSKTLTMLYLPSWMNLQGYACGMAAAFLFHHTQVKGVKLNQNKSFNIVFHMSLLLCSCVVAVGALFLRDHPPPEWAEVVYSSLDRLIVAIFFNVFLLGCITKCKSGLRSMFEWRGFHFLGRVSYSVFLIHFLLLRLTLSGTTQLVHISASMMINLIISATVLSYTLAIPFCLIFELPPLQLWKVLTERSERSDRNERARSHDVTSQTEAAVKPLDLVANIRRRQEV